MDTSAHKTFLEAGGGAFENAGSETAARRYVSSHRYYGFCGFCFWMRSRAVAKALLLRASRNGFPSYPVHCVASGLRPLRFRRSTAKDRRREFKEASKELLEIRHSPYYLRSPFVMTTDVIRRTPSDVDCILEQNFVFKTGPWAV
ncbi:hypothetical protein EVAR_8953_1 [Eumeta japonica]|uniref:Uncharacterized protein n=1 Tax=Eumeta variegata TaxID=151549 RepID=A0A4C1U0B7_EUMVA|nr:hypothetical protein EVAR_8953_1 [Eumeta japonica]